MECMSEVNFCVDLCFAWSVKHIRDSWKRILALLQGFVETSEVNTEFLLLYEEDRSSMQRDGGSDESYIYMFINEFSESLYFTLRE
jgi:hypothetical protein